MLSVLTQKRDSYYQDSIKIKEDIGFILFFNSRKLYLDNESGYIIAQPQITK